MLAAGRVGKHASERCTTVDGTAGAVTRTSSAKKEFAGRLKRRERLQPRARTRGRRRHDALARSWQCPCHGHWSTCLLFACVTVASGVSRFLYTQSAGILRIDMAYLNITHELLSAMPSVLYLPMLEITSSHRPTLAALLLATSVHRWAATTATTGIERLVSDHRPLSPQ